MAPVPDRVKVREHQFRTLLRFQSCGAVDWSVGGLLHWQLLSNSDVKAIMYAH